MSRIFNNIFLYRKFRRIIVCKRARVFMIFMQLRQDQIPFLGVFIALDMPFELGAKGLDDAGDKNALLSGQKTAGLIGAAAADLKNRLHIVLGPLPHFNVFEAFCNMGRAAIAGDALAAGAFGQEIAEFKRSLHHAGAFIINNKARGAQTAAGFL